MSKTILLVEDEESLQFYLKSELSFENYTVTQCFNGKNALDLLESKTYDLVILDWMLPERSGIDVLRRLRRQGSNIPVIIMTARSEVDDKVTGLDSGANDYITKPFEIEELLARIRVLLRVAKTNPKDEYSYNDLILNRKTHRVTLMNQSILLTQREFDLLNYFLENIDVVVSRDEILDSVWGIDFSGQYNTVDVNVRHLRQKLYLPDRSYIQTERSLGYVLRVDFNE
ncbi:two-component response regulator [Leuconostoc inhae]|uniref:DNA-binding response regulator, OmpR family (Rec-wHTH domains) n=1 Tax=Leuconostoc inhae TaxID=178001 RepID=A0AAN2UGW8_9LACO|nr:MULTISPECIES: response regulator transcription factor [Leuconostoc]MBZ5983226.1 response regulator transcription factor [Leuconostoc gasicomitatum]MCT4377482.1 DNA-binding response regulator [Leuconostoc suionicum]MCT8383617.1 DNA-binding response regulator [Leuconostoc mesenteroides]MDV8952199.1 response regulator [Leuconostoc falkenbergense]TOZ03801.1 DNA-binding response regulator [Leuconostoc pseudomesenteroides]